MTERDRKSSQYWVVGLMAAAFLVTFGIGCAKTDNTPLDTPVARTDSDTTLTPPEDPGLDDKPERDPVQNLNYLRKLDGHWTVKLSTTLECHKPAECDGNQRVHIDIWVHKLTFKIDAARIVTQNGPNLRGHIVAKIINRDPFPYTPLGLLANDSVYLWVGKTDTAQHGHPAPRRERAFAVYQIDQQGRATGVARAYGGIRCFGPPRSDSSEVHFVRLSDPCDLGRRRDTLYKAPPHMTTNTETPLHDQGLWFACDGGCCQATNFGGY